VAFIRLENVTLRYPIYGILSKSVRSTLLSKLGGRIGEHEQTVIVEALNDFSIDLKDGDRLGIVGHNGAGKSTLLRVMSGVCQPQRGRVSVQGNLASFVDITLGMDPEATGSDNIIFRGVFLGLSFKEARDLAPSVAEFSELGEYLSLPVRTYSSGMYMRLAFAVSTSIRPEIIIMDEMISAGDARFLDKAIERITSMLDQTKIVVIASHSNDIITRFCNKVLWMDRGRARALGSADDIVAQYREAAGENGSPASDMRPPLKAET
jgi:ABC-type polysaccharide/polyol phosphate transport system ATPase subunit